MDFRQQKACVFFMRMVLANAERIAVENPIGIMSNCYRKPDQIIQPYQFGDEHRKATCLWLKNLPELKPTKVVEPRIKSYIRHDGRVTTFDELYVNGGWGKNRAKLRSRTFHGIAQAMADQWGNL